MRVGAGACSAPIGGAFLALEGDPQTADALDVAAKLPLDTQRFAGRDLLPIHPEDRKRVEKSEEFTNREHSNKNSDSGKNDE